MGRPSSSVHDQPGADRGGTVDQYRRRTMTALFLVVLVNVVGFGIVIPLLPFYAQEFGASSLTVGLLFASYAAAQVVAVPVLGYLADRHGRRPVLLLSLAGSLVGFLVLALAQHLAMLFAARIIDGASGGNLTTARAAVADVTPEEERAAAYGTLGAAVALGTVVGPALGGLLAGASFRLPGAAAALLAGGAILLVWVWLPETLPADTPPRGWPWQEGRTLLGADLASFLGTDLAYWAAFAAFQTAFPLFIVERLGYGAQGTGLLLGYVGAISAVVRLRLIGAFSARFGDRKTLAGGLVLAGVGISGVAVAHGLPLVLAALTPAAFGIAVAYPALTSLLSRCAGPEIQGQIHGISGSTEALGRGVGPLWGNGLLGAAGAGLAYGSVAVALLVLGVWSTRLPRPAPPGQERA